MQAAFTDGIFEALRIGVGFLWSAAWAIIMGLIITSLVQVYVSKERLARVLGEGDLTGLTKSSVFGAASSGCSFGAVAIGKGLFKTGAHAVNFMAFMFASTNHDSSRYVSMLSSPWPLTTLAVGVPPLLSNEDN